MFEFITSTDENAISLIKADHDKVKGLFDQFKDAKSLAVKKKIVAEAIMELKLHASVEEEIFYPAVRKAIGKKVMTEADEEHHVAKVLIAELEIMTGKEEHYDAKFTVLAESIRHHIREEEDNMLPKAKHLPIDMEKLGQKILARKKVLKKTGVAVFAEEKMVRRTRSGDSPARNSHKKPARKVKSSVKAKAIGKRLPKVTVKRHKARAARNGKAA